MYDGSAGNAFASAETLKRARILVKDMGREASCWDGMKTSWYEYALMAVSILAGIVFLPVLISIYLIPSIREAFDQLAYEDAMRG